MSEALSTYTLLTIGDGLVAQIPALLIAIGAGFIVTRVNGDEANLGRNMMTQLLGHPLCWVSLPCWRSVWRCCQGSRLRCF